MISLDFEFPRARAPDPSHVSPRTPPGASHLAPPRPSLRWFLTSPLPPALVVVAAGLAAEWWSGGVHRRPVVELLAR
jgi:hypothetical protein